MFGSNALPRPSNFTSQEHHHPLRLTTDVRSAPAGPCHYVLLHPSVQNQRCSCQSFHHNRAVPGNICDCGHQACFHLTQPASQDPSRESISVATEDALLDRIKRLEETIHHEREIRDNALQRERILWEREVRVLREALSPFYKSEQDMRRKLIEVEDRIEGNYDEQVRMKDRLVALDDANMALEKRVDDIQQSRPKRRRIARSAIPEDSLMQVSSSDDRRISDDRSVQSNSSLAISPGSTFTPMPPEAEEARSSGILDLMARSRIQSVPVVRNAQHQAEEARSSGFLALDLAERLGKTQMTSTEHPLPPAGPPPPPYMLLKDRYSPPGYAQSDPDAHPRRSPSSAPPAQSAADLSPRKRKHHVEHLALDVLADVSMASPLISG